jgi:hypothetical protein
MRKNCTIHYEDSRLRKMRSLPGPDGKQVTENPVLQELRINAQREPNPPGMALTQSGSAPDCSGCLSATWAGAKTFLPGRNVASFHRYIDPSNHRFVPSFGRAQLRRKVRTSQGSLKKHC